MNTSLFDAPGIVKIPGGHYIKNLGSVRTPTGIRLRVRNGRHYWVATRAGNARLGEESFYYAVAIESSEEAWFKYRDAVKALHNHVDYLYRGRHYARVEAATKKIPTGKVGVFVTGPEDGTQTVLAVWGKDVLFREQLYSQHKYRSLLNQAIAAREKREHQWYEENVLSLKEALELIDRKIVSERRASRKETRQRNQQQSMQQAR